VKQIYKYEFLKNLFKEQAERDRANKFLRRLPIVPIKIDYHRGPVYGYDEFINVLKQYKCREGSHAYKIKEKILRIHDEKRTIAIK